MESDEPRRVLALGVAMEGWLEPDPPKKRRKRLAGVVRACDRYLAPGVDNLTDADRSDITSLRAVALRLLQDTRDG